MHAIRLMAHTLSTSVGVIVACLESRTPWGYCWMVREAPPFIGSRLPQDTVAYPKKIMSIDYTHTCPFRPYQYQFVGSVSQLISPHVQKALPLCKRPMCFKVTWGLCLCGSYYTCTTYVANLSLSSFSPFNLKITQECSWYWRNFSQRCAILKRLEYIVLYILNWASIGRIF